MGILRRRRWGATRRTDTGCAMCWGTCESGWRTAGTRAMRGRRRTGVRGCRGSAAGVCCAAAPGTTTPGSSAQPTASGLPPAAGTTASGSVLPGRSRPESLPPYLRGGQWAEPPDRFARGLPGAPASPWPAPGGRYAASRAWRALRPREPCPAERGALTRQGKRVGPPARPVPSRSLLRAGAGGDAVRGPARRIQPP